MSQYSHRVTESEQQYRDDIGGGTAEVIMILRLEATAHWFWRLVTYVNSVEICIPTTA